MHKGQRIGTHRCKAQGHPDDRAREKVIPPRYRCPNGPSGTDPARTRFGPVRIGSGQARPVDASGRVGLAHVPRDMPKPGTHREKSCRAGPVGLNGPGRALARTNSRTVYKYIYLIELIIYNNILFIYIKTTKYLCMHFIFMYAFYICLATYLVFTYYERIKCIYIFSIYINMRAAVGLTHLSGRAGPKHAGRRICPYPTR
jgi:hypothetical protein